MRQPSDLFAEFFASTPDELKPIVTELRGMVKRTAPGLAEHKRYGMPSYVAEEESGKPTIVYIMSASDHVNLGFYDGVDIEDPKKRLEGTGKRLRHVKVYSLADAKDPALRALVKEAVRLRKA